MVRRIIQFGTSRFLQAHADLFVHEAREAGQDIGPITVVKTTPGQERTGRLAGLRQPGGFPVRIRGWRAGVEVDDTIQVLSVDQALATGGDWDEIVNLFANEVEIAISNTGDRGYDLLDDDLNYQFGTRHIPRSFPGKLLLLLFERYRATGSPLLFLPCELVVSNGQAIRRQVSTLANAWQMRGTFRDWLDSAIVFADTLVDRIVSEEISPIGAIAEPYALWAIGKGGFEPPFEHPSVVYTENLEHFERLKLHILNLGHTILADLWLSQQRPAGETVAGILSEPAIRQYLREIFYEEVIPGFAARSLGDESERYVEVTIGRYDNPFLDHRIADIARDHETKVGRRIAAFLTWSQGLRPALGMPRLAEIAAKYR